MRTVSDLLYTEEFKNNQTRLAKTLDVNRGTLRTYMADTKGAHHEIREFKGKLQLLTLNSRAKR